MTPIFPKPIKRDIAYQTAFTWQVGLTLLALFVGSAIANIPFSKEIRKLKLAPGEHDLKLLEPLQNTILETTLSAAIIGSVSIFLGLLVCRKVHLGAPGLNAIFSKNLEKYFNKKILFACLSLAVITAILLLGLIELQKEYFPIVHEHERPSKIFYLLGSFVAAVTEEIIFRLGIMSSIIACIQVLKNADKPPSVLVYWVGIIVSSLLFGVMHIPMSNNFLELTAVTIVITIFGNLITGSVFGWVFWRWGLLNAMLTHFVFDIIFHVIGTPFS